jgi:iron-sulfur cluster assembly accessory protein
MSVKERAMVMLTKTAAEMVKRMTHREKLLGYGLRVAIVGGGLNGFEYTLSFCEASSPSDLVFKSEGFFLYVDPVSYVYVNGVTIDYIKTDSGEGFVFVNPKSFSSWENQTAH